MNKHELGKEQGIGVQEFRSSGATGVLEAKPHSATPELLQLLNSFFLVCSTVLLLCRLNFMEMVIPPGSTIGLLGGGQLGRMFAIAARRMGYRVHTF
jgi:hypothetical protein